MTTVKRTIRFIAEWLADRRWRKGRFRRIRREVAGAILDFDDFTMIGSCVNTVRVQDGDMGTRLFADTTVHEWEEDAVVQCFDRYWKGE